MMEKDTLVFCGVLREGADTHPDFYPVQLPIFLAAPSKIFLDPFLPKIPHDKDVSRTKKIGSHQTARCSDDYYHTPYTI
eukprot:scaffold464_cov181-Amphora_coffeaeformis.AAC.21